MLVTEALMKEHQLILSYVDLMECYAELSLKNPQKFVLLEKAHGFIAFIHEFADDFHHAKEEELLFRYLEVPGVLTHCNPIPQMLNEHSQARELVLNIEQALHTSNNNKLADNVARYAQLLKEHIYKEDNILYPMAERGLADTAKSALLKAMTETDERLDGPAIWRKYETLYADLENQLLERTHPTTNC